MWETKTKQKVGYSMKEVTIYQGVVSKQFHSDMMITKTHEDPKNPKKPWQEVLCASFFGYSSDLKDYLRGGRKMVIFYNESKFSEVEKFVISDLDDYNVTQIKSGDFLKIVVTKRIDAIIKQESEEEDKDAKKKLPSYPLLFLTDENHEEQKNRVYNMVRNGVTTPMFPNVEEYLILAGQLFIDKEEARVVLDVLKGKSAEPIDRGIYERAKFLMKCYDEWKEYIFEEMKSHDLIKPVNVKYTPSPLRVFEVIINESIIEKIIQDGMKRGDIRFTKSRLFKKKIEDFNEFMTKFAPAMSQRIDSLAKPIHRNGDIRRETAVWFDKMMRTPMHAQQNAMEACLKSLELQGKVNLIGEPGVGKTLMMMGTNWIYNKMKGRNMKLLVFCPDTLVYSTWKKELLETIPDVKVHVIESITDLVKFEQKGFLDDNYDRAFILSQGKAKSGYSLKPAVHWSKTHQSFQCTDCGTEIVRKVKNPSKDPTEPRFIEEPVPFDYFSTATAHNRRCKNKKCRSIFWEPYNKNSVSDTAFVYLTDPKGTGVGGFFPKDKRPVKRMLADLVKQHNATNSKKEKARIQKKIEQYRILEMTIDGTMEEGRKISPYRVSIAEYISKKMKHKFTNLIIDEFHEFQGDSARSDACVNLIKAIPVVQTGTGTAMNGYAKSRFKTDYMLFPEKMKEHGFKITDEAKYQVAFGVTEKKYRLSRKDGKDKKATLKPVDKPGISPVIFPLFMQDTSVFISLSDLKEELPDLHHYQIEVDLDPVLETAKKEFEAQIKKHARYDKKLFRTSIQVGYSFLDMPTVEREILDPDTKEVIMKTPTVPGYVDNKMHALLDFVKQEVEVDRRRVMIYTYYTGDGINDYLRNSLVKEGYKVTLLNKQTDLSVLCDGSTKKIKKEDRSDFIHDEVERGTEVLIVNPELIKTGMNLIEFPTICYYQMGYQVYTNRQADRRAWRIGQTQDCKIVYIYYKDSIQHDIASLMATKIVASQAIEGHMDAAGLEAILNERTAEEELAKKFFEGIRGKIAVKKYAEEEDDEITV